MMQFQLCCKNLFAVVLMSLCCAAPAFAADTAHDAAPEQDANYDYTITAAPKDASHPFYGKGGPLGFVVNGVQGRTLVVVRGRTYRFKVSTSVMHDVYLSTDALGWGTAALTDGVTGNYTYKGVITFKPTAETPDLVYYACRNHKYMGGEIHVVNPGEEGKVQITAPQAAAAKDGAALDKNEVTQRVNFVDMSIAQSDAARRIVASGNEDANAQFREALARLAAAKNALAADNLQQAKIQADEAMALMAKAAQLVPSESAQRRAKTKYEELLRGVKDMEESYKQNRESAGKSGGKEVASLDSDKIHKMMDAAAALSAQDKYDEANKILADAMSEVSSVLNKMLTNSTMSYEMKFSSDAEEYGYELERFNSLEEMIPQAIEQKQPPQTTLALFDTYVNKGKAKRDEAVANAKQQNFAAALQSIKQGTEQLETALKLIGVH
jgi:hypothetical protein